MSELLEVVEYVSREGDRWDLLAWKFYGDPTAYEILIAANPGVYIEPLIESGTLLIIPVIDYADASTAEGLPPWKA